MKNKGFLKYLFNTTWLLGGKVYRVGLGLLITVWMARYLGPEQFGVFNYALSFVTIFSVFVSLGLDNLIVREVINKPKEELNILSSALLMRLLGGVVLFLISTLMIMKIRPDDQVMLMLVMAFSIGFFFKSFEVLRFWFEAHVKGKYSAVIEVVAISVSVSVKAGFIIYELPLIYFAWTLAVETVAMSIGLVAFYSSLGGSLNIFKASFKKMSHLIKEAWPLILAGTLYIIYAKIDQIMLGEMVGNEAVGIYAAAVKLSEGWFFVPIVISASLYPAMLSARKVNMDVYYQRTQQLLSLMVVIGFTAAFGIMFIAAPLVLLMFGPEYKSASEILIVHIWGGIFLAMSGVSYRYFIAEGLQKYSFYRGLTGVVVNIVFNIWLIPLYGAMGAAIATVISQFMALYLFNVTNTKTRKMFIMQTRALLLLDFLSALKFLIAYKRKI